MPGKKGEKNEAYASSIKRRVEEYEKRLRAALDKADGDPDRFAELALAIHPYYDHSACDHDATTPARQRCNYRRRFADLARLLMRGEQS